MNALAKKLQVKPGKNWLVYNAPGGYLSLLEPLPEGVTISYEAEGNFDGVQLFVRDSAELAQSLISITKVLRPDTIFWVIYPKKSGGVPTDLEMMSSWDEMTRHNLRSVAAAAVNETWTALRFRPEGTGTYSDTCNDAIPQNEYAAYVDVANKTVTLPADMAAMLQENPAAMNFYQSLSYSNRKEYVLWIVTAKQEKTRLDRLAKALDKLLVGKKNPGEK